MATRTGLSLVVSLCLFGANVVPAAAQPAPPAAPPTRPEAEAEEAARDAEPGVETPETVEPPTATTAREADASSDLPTDAEEALEPLQGPSDTGSSPAEDPTRELPQDYESREQEAEPKPEDARRWTTPPSTEVEDYFLFVPRIVLFPPNLVLKIVAMPLRGAAILIDRYYLIEHTKDLLYNDARTAGILPALGFQTGYGLTYGLKAFHDDLFGNDEEINVAARYGGLYVQAYGMSFVGDQIAHTPVWVEANANYEVKPALFFHGIGNEPVTVATPGVSPREAAVATRFRENRSMARLTLGASVGDLGDRSHVGVTGLFNHRSFGPERRNFEEPSIDEIYDTSQVPGFDSGVDVFELTPTFIYDSRDFEATPSKGVYLDVFGGHTLPISEDADYWHYGANFATFVNLYHKTRVLSFRALVEAVHGRDEDIPFTELIKLGGPNSLRGYQLDRFRDKVSALGTLEYRYPVHQMVSGEVFVDAGRVGRDYSEIFDKEGLEEFHYGGGLGFVFHSNDSIWFKAQAAYGEQWLLFISTDPLRAFRRRHKRL